MMTIILLMLLAFTPNQTVNQVTDLQKQEFLKLIETLPVKGEFFTDEAVAKATPYLPVLFALTEQDLEKYDIYPFAAISSGLAENKEQRAYAVQHFAGIRHPQLKLFWAVTLFNREVASSEIMRFLKNVLCNEEQTKLLAEMTGPQFQSFKQRVAAHHD